MKNIIHEKIFIVDDDFFANKVYERILHNLGCTDVQSFVVSVDALNHLIQKPRIILLDYHMDHINGFEMLKKIKRFDPNIFVIMISSQEDLTTAIEMMKYGAFDYVAKGKDEERKLIKAMARISKVKQLMEEKKPNLFQKIFK